MDEISPAFLSSDEIGLLIAPWREQVAAGAQLSFVERLNFCIQYFKYLDDLVNRKILYIPYAASLVQCGLGLIRNSGRDDMDQVTGEIWEVMIDLEVPNLMTHFVPRDRPLSDWKIIEDFIQKYGAEIN